MKAKRQQLRITYKNDLKKLELVPNSFETLKSLLYQLCEITFNRALKIHYKDEDNDFILIDKQNEYEEFLKNSQHLYVIKLYVKQESEDDEAEFVQVLEDNSQIIPKKTLEQSQLSFNESEQDIKTLIDQSIKRAIPTILETIKKEQSFNDISEIKKTKNKKTKKILPSEEKLLQAPQTNQKTEEIKNKYSSKLVCILNESSQSLTATSNRIANKKIVLSNDGLAQWPEGTYLVNSTETCYLSVRRFEPNENNIVDVMIPFSGKQPGKHTEVFQLVYPSKKGLIQIGGDIVIPFEVTNSKLINGELGNCIP